MLDWPEPLLPAVPLVPEVQSHDGAAEVVGVAGRQLNLVVVGEQWVDIIAVGDVQTFFCGRTRLS